MKQSGGIRAFGVLFIVLNVLGILSVLIAAGDTVDIERARWQLLFSLLFFSMGVISAIGLVRLSEWARWATLVLTALVLAGALWGVLAWHSFGMILVICWTGFILFYFLRPSVKVQFARGR